MARTRQGAHRAHQTPTARQTRVGSRRSIGTRKNPSTIFRWLREHRVFLYALRLLSSDWAEITAAFNKRFPAHIRNCGFTESLPKGPLYAQFQENGKNNKHWIGICQPLEQYERKDPAMMQEIRTLFSRLHTEQPASTPSSVSESASRVQPTLDESNIVTPAGNTFSTDGLRGFAYTEPYSRHAPIRSALRNNQPQAQDLSSTEHESCIDVAQSLPTSRSVKPLRPGQQLHRTKRNGPAIPCKFVQADEARPPLPALFYRFYDPDEIATIDTYPGGVLRPVNAPLQHGFYARNFIGNRAPIPDPPSCDQLTSKMMFTTIEVSTTNRNQKQDG